MQDLDSLIDAAISTGQESKANENQKPVTAVYSRKKKNAEPIKQEEVVTPQLTTAELKAKLNSKRQEQIQNRKKKTSSKNKSTPLTPLYFCDAPNCNSITNK